jgi:hypothetical protein
LDLSSTGRRDYQQGGNERPAQKSVLDGFHRLFWCYGT